MINPAIFMQQLQSFARTIQGDPQQQVMQLMQSGQMSQEAYGRYSKIAEMISNGNQQGALNTIFGTGRNQ